ncbi:MAG: methylated-DNA--[protein]-cysteine S-methyltransferase [Deltaproteobacteria bacterium]|nr:methylated-DNA--[protein]-cysteine S-methyltransferase [Deltaproteobacteria bacterium]
MFPSPIGRIWVASDRVGVCLVKFGLRQEEFLEEASRLCLGHPLPDQRFNAGVFEEIVAYFEGRLTRFSSPLHPQGTPFDMKVWEAVKRIPFGETRSYQEIARQVGNPRGCRAVGGANRRNPVPLIIPCHRVIQKDGGLGGFSSGIEIKKWLLRFEREISLGHKGSTV